MVCLPLSPALTGDRGSLGHGHYQVEGGRGSLGPSHNSRQSLSEVAEAPSSCGQSLGDTKNCLVSLLLPRCCLGPLCLGLCQQQLGSRKREGWWVLIPYLLIWLFKNITLIFLSS